MKKLLWILLLLLAAWLLWRFWHRDRSLSASGGEKLFYNRLWVDHLPKSDTDIFNLVVAVTDEPMGIFQATSNWRGQYEGFHYEPAGDGKATIFYPQTKQKERVSYHAVACQQPGFDYCLELGGASRGVQRYYSQRGWELGQLSSLSALTHRLSSGR